VITSPLQLISRYLAHIFVIAVKKLILLLALSIQRQSVAII